MLIESMVKKTLGIKSHVVKTVTPDGDGLAISLDVRKRRRLPCSGCGHLGRLRDRLAVRTWKHVPLWGIPVAAITAPVASGEVAIEAIRCVSGVAPVEDQSGKRHRVGIRRRCNRHWRDVMHLFAYSATHWCTPFIRCTPA